MLALTLLACVPALMWLSQALTLRAAGLPPRWRLDAAGLPPRARLANRIATNTILASVLIAYPLLRGQSPFGYYAGFFPADRFPAEALRGLASALIYLALLYAAWVATDQVRIRVRHPAHALARRIAAAIPAALLGALLEELLFRAVLLNDLLAHFPPATAVAAGVIVFAAAHYVRRVKRYWTFAGHLGLGLLLSSAFIWTGALWLPVGLHAGGILMLSGIRPFARYRGPAWLVGASIFPYAGAAGLIGLTLLTLNLWLSLGIAP
jgi:membrane protease YdiL (CAAX protease family)